MNVQYLAITKLTQRERSRERNERFWNGVGKKHTTGGQYAGRRYGTRGKEVINDRYVVIMLSVSVASDESEANSHTELLNDKKEAKQARNDVVLRGKGRRGIIME